MLELAGTDFNAVIRTLLHEQKIKNKNKKELCSMG